MRIILNKNLWQKLGVDKTCPTCHNGSMMRNREMRDYLPNENHYHLDFKSNSKKINEVNII
jgi:hypothetical protein|tara:strand:- start:2234 stop:2416 length:183 start_codon:yes stop_codon:yes gene_type:complete